MEEVSETVFAYFLVRKTCFSVGKFCVRVEDALHVVKPVSEQILATGVR